MPRPRPAFVRIVPIAGCVMRVPAHGPPLVGVFLNRDANLPRYFLPAAWYGLSERVFGTALAHRFPT